MSDDLVKRLRSGNTGQQTWIGLCEDAADYIETLTKERDELREEVQDLIYELNMGNQYD